MKVGFYYILFLFLLQCNIRNQKEVNSTEYRIGFYNVENLFDTIDDASKNDEWFLPTSEIKWNTDKYQTKLQNLSLVVAQLAEDQLPDVLGLCEVENQAVVEELLQQDILKGFEFEVICTASPDERGIDVALVYNKNKFVPDKTEFIAVDLSSFEDKTRDILHVAGRMNSGHKVHFYVNHWSSRSEGKEESEPKRMQAARALKSSIDQEIKNDPGARIIVMGDFNDEPLDPSISGVLNAEEDPESVSPDELYNPMIQLKKAGIGSYKYRDWWNMLDQFMLSAPLVNEQKGLVYALNSAGIKNEDWLQQHGNKYEGFPLRTFGGRNYLAGFSDHFPVYIKLIIKE